MNDFSLCFCAIDAQSHNLIFGLQICLPFERYFYSKQNLLEISLFKDQIILITQMISNYLRSSIVKKVFFKNAGFSNLKVYSS